MRRTVLALAATAIVAPAALPASAVLAQTSGTATAATRGPVETSSPNAGGQEPAFANQARAPQPGEPAPVQLETVADGLPGLWSLEFLPEGRMLVTAKSGDMHVVDADGEAGEPIANVPEVVARGQGGLLDVALAPDFARTGTIFFSFSEPRGDGTNGTSVASARLALDDANSGALQNVEVVFQQMPAYAGNKHFGSRLEFAPDGTLFVTVGERSDTPIRDRAQDLTAGMGKVFRINADGSAPDDNPFVDQASVQPEIWSYGHRNLQSAVVDSEGQLWTVEHGPRGGDELNHPEAGLNYGWPVITYGIDYSGRPIGDGITAMEGMEQPVYYWDPVIAPSGMAQYEGDEFPEWQGAFLIGGLEAQAVVVVDTEDDRVVTEARVPIGARVRDVKVGPDGAVYVVTETRRGGSSIVRLTREPAA